MSSALQLIIEVFSKSSCFEVVCGLARLDHEPWDIRELQPHGPFWVLMIGPFVQDYSAVTPEVSIVPVMGMGQGQKEGRSKGSQVNQE
jgi:hypothetical protein